uniref:DDHD domain-containing protein n=1 Tax=Ciona savignyi TaxID=51511 RepID=H2Y8N8_CIOSA
MLIKEYRIPMPLSVQEYRIAQLYMIQKKSREESQGTESGVEIIQNKPYEDGPGGSGQYTQKIYHISKHIPGWLVAILPKDALIVEEEAWNAYPYTRTRYTCPFIEKFSIDIETRYFDDTGEKENVFDLPKSDFGRRIVDEIDLVNEQSSDYKKEEDPRHYVSKKTGRGPLSEDWLSIAKKSSPKSRGNFMCAYKQCKVEFKYWGMQSKIEKFIHDTGLRKVMLRAHKQAWCWQDEWHGLTINDIRRLEKETQLALQIKFGVNTSDSDNTLVDLEESENNVENNSFSQTNLSSRQTGKSVIIATTDAVLFNLQCQESKKHNWICEVWVAIICGNESLEIKNQLNHKSDVHTLQSTLEAVMKSYYKSVYGRLAVRLVSCPAICTEAYHLLQRSVSVVYDLYYHTISSAMLSIFGTSSPKYMDTIRLLACSCNFVYNNFILSSEGKGFNGQVCIISDTMGSVLAYDLLCSAASNDSSRRNSSLSYHEVIFDFLLFQSVSEEMSSPTLRVLGPPKWDFPQPNPQSISQAGNHHHHRNSPPRQISEPLPSISLSQLKLDFEVSELFMLGSPLGIVLAMRHANESHDNAPTPSLKPPLCRNVYNLFYPADPSSARIEPLLDPRFSNYAPSNVPKYHLFPLGDGQSISLVASHWWGEKRIDFSLFSPDVIGGFPSASLPHLFHSSFWESADVAAFLLRQIFQYEHMHYQTSNNTEIQFTQTFPTEKWLRKRTNVKLRNLTANHRCRDSVALECTPQVLVGRFMYGPLDMLTLTGEKVDIYIMTPPPASEWVYMDTEICNNSGKVTYNIPESKSLTQGLYPVKMIVRGDHTSADSNLAVLCPQTECVIFSIDGSFTASMSIMGSDPKVRPGAVDVVRLWQDLGYLIIYVTGRPDMQKHRVVTWLAQHNFPHGMIWFGDGLSKDPLKQKTILLKNLKTENKLIYAAGYGSSKDIAVYSQLDIEPDRIFIV